MHRSPTQHISSPVPWGELLYVSGPGQLNKALFEALSLQPDAAERVAWTKTGPFLKLPTVCSPAIVEDVLVFGDGMHQTDGATMYCIKAATGRPLWQYTIPGRLVHMEAPPTVDQGRVYFGAGDAGIVCLDLKRAVLDKKEMDLAAVSQLMEQKWKELSDAYERDKVTKGEFAIPPDDSALPKPAAKLIWQKGQQQLHVDTAVAVVNGKLIAGSAFVEDDKAGKRVLVCLNAADGAPLWETPLDINPWGGPTMFGDLAIVGCSSIRFDKKLVKEGKGEVVAVDINNGQVKWRKPVPGGVLSPVSVKDGLAVFTATDGKVRGWDAATGAERWAYDGGAPFFAGVAIAGGVVYAADLRAAVHAIDLKGGQRKWLLEVASDPAVQAPGMVFGAPVIHGGDLFLATNNLEGESAEIPSVVVCISDKPPSLAAVAMGKATVDRANRTVSVPCRIAPRKLPSLKEVYPLEVVATFPQGQKAHETVVIFDVKPSAVHEALKELGLTPGRPARGEDSRPSGPEVGVFLSMPGVAGEPILVPIERAMVDRRTGKPMPPLRWHFTGSAQRQLDPNRPDKVYGADLTGTLISLFPVTDETVLQSSMSMREASLLKLETNQYVLPPVGTPVELVIKVK